MKSDETTSMGNAFATLAPGENPNLCKQKTSAKRAAGGGLVYENLSFRSTFSPRGARFFRITRLRNWRHLTERRNLGNPFQYGMTMSFSPRKSLF
jgi:hypothetical protein